MVTAKSKKNNRTMIRLFCRLIKMKKKGVRVKMRTNKNTNENNEQLKKQNNNLPFRGRI